MVAFTVPKYPVLPNTLAAKEFVEVAFVVVENVVVNPPLNASAVVVALFGKRYENELPLEKVRQELAMAKQPLARLMPLENVELAAPV